ncbi:MAG: nitroreductase [Syntrophaceae bacterium]|nr:nitroreductase [Syntrophaceae bacterium]
MDIKAAVKGRRSIRKFIDKEVPQEIIRDILETARWSPSWGNTQSWNFHVITGEPLARFKQANQQMLMEDLPATPDIPMPESWPDACRLRYNDMGRMLYDSLGIARRDTDARRKLRIKMAYLFDAPCLIVPTIHRENAVEYAMLDIGLIVQTLCLLAYEKGLGTLIMAAAVQYPGLIREIAGIPEDRRIVAGIALGYPDTEYELNNFERKRAKLEEFIHWVG